MFTKAVAIYRHSINGNVPVMGPEIVGSNPSPVVGVFILIRLLMQTEA